LYSSPNIIPAIQVKETEKVGHVAHVDERRGACGVLVGRREGRNHLEDPGIDGSITLKWLFKKWVWGNGLDRFGSG
jgi:hypothetical protein